MAIAQVTQQEMKQLKQFFEGAPLGKVLATARSRRVGRGYSIEPGVEQTHPVTGRKLLQTKGPLSFVSTKEPAPLTEVEEAILLWSACGPNGTIAWDIAIHGASNELMSLAGRTIPSPGNSLATDMLVINDRGTYLYKATRDRNKPIEIEGEEDYPKILQWYREGLVKLSDQRPDIDWATKPEGCLNGSVFGPYQYNINRSGSTMFVPLQDVGWLYLSVLPIILQWNGYYMVDDRTGEPAGLKKWVDQGLLTIPSGISQIEELIFQVEMYPVGCMVQNIRLAGEALGIGTWVFCGYSDDALMGALPGVCSGLGFRCEPLNTKAPTLAGQLKTFGLEGVKEATYVPSPKYRNGEECIRALMQEKYGSGAALAKDGNNWMLRTGAPYKREVAEQVINHPVSQVPEWAIEATAAYIDYCVEHYGQCPVYWNPMQCQFMAQVHHVDEAFYDQYYVSGYVTEGIRRHFQAWH